MRLARCLGPVGGELAVVDPSGAHWRRTGLGQPLETLLDGPGLARLAEAAARQPAEPVDPALLLPPLVPRVIVGVGLNYRAHALEQGREPPATPQLFLKNPHSLAPPCGDLAMPSGGHILDHEPELALVVGRALGDERDVDEGAVAGWMVAQDYTLRDLARPPTLVEAKGGAAMAPLGPWLTPAREVPLAQALSLAIGARVNGQPRRAGSTSDMIAPPLQLLRHIARYLPLGPGDVVLTGSPGRAAGATAEPPRLAPGDVVETEIAGLGQLRQRLVRRS